MSDQERLEKLNNLLERYYAAENSFEQTDLAISIIQGHVDWLIKQAMRAIEGEEELDRWLSGRNVAVSTYGEIRGLNEENARLRKALKEITYEGHSCRDGARAFVYQHSLSQAVQIAFNALEEGKNE